MNKLSVSDNVLAIVRSKSINGKIHSGRSLSDNWETTIIMIYNTYNLINK